MNLLFIAAGGALGALLRYGVSGWVYRFTSGDFPWGTIAVNLSGCFLIGFLWESAQRVTISPEIRSLIFIGFLGAFTTFSTFGLETVNLLRDGEIRQALNNILLSNISGIALVFAGLFASRAVFRLLE